MWMDEQTYQDDVALCTRVRLARNIKEMKFPNLNQQKAAEVVDRVRDALSGMDYQVFSMQDIPAANQQALIEQHLCSPDLLKAYGGAIAISKDECSSILINEEDHLRIQVLGAGEQIPEVFARAVAIDQALEKKIEYAYDPLLGYLTACPSNMGTGIRVSVMLHLPALSMTGRMREIQQNLQSNGLALRGIYGEGSQALGNIYQVSNSISLGPSEKELADGVEHTVKTLIEQEKKAREAICKNIEIQDKIMRAYGTLQYAKKISQEEFMQLWSDAKMGAAQGMIPLSAKQLLELLIQGQPAMLLTYRHAENTRDGLGMARAQLCNQMTKLS